MNKKLCKPCAVALAEKGKTVIPLDGRSQKVTCAECARRRFGSAYDVTGRIRRTKKEDKDT